jgi:hypothetical protein
MSDKSAAQSLDAQPNASSPSLPLPILTEDDIAALPRAPSSSSSSPSLAGSAADHDDHSHHAAAAAAAAVPTSTDASHKHSEASSPHDDVEEEANELCAEDATTNATVTTPHPPVAHHNNDGNDEEEEKGEEDIGESGEVLSPVDAPLAMPESLPAPPSTSTASPSSTASFPHPTIVSPFTDSPAVVEDAGVACDTPTVVDSEAESREDDGSNEANTAANAFSEEAVAESVRSSEAQANAALHLLSTSLHAKLVERLIDDAALAVETTLTDTIRQHGTRIRALIAHNHALDAQLQNQAAQMQDMQREWEETMVQDLQRVLRVDVRATLRAQSPPHEVQSSEHAAQLSADAATMVLPTSVDELVAAYLGTRSTIAILQRERDEWRSNVAALRGSLLAATQENATLRHDVEQLRTTTVDFDLYRVAVQAREEAEHQCELLQLQLTRQIEEAETLVALVERQELTQQQMRASAATAVASAPADGAAQVDPSMTAAGSDDAVRKGPMWSAALRELEEQAAMAAESHHLRDQLATATAALKRLEAERDASVAYAAALKKEGDVLRADAQSMVYRNSVLSQQVASLLVKVERTARACRHLQGRLSSHEERPQSEIAKQECTLGPSKLLTSLPSPSSRRSNWLASAWPAMPAPRSTAVTRNATPAHFAAADASADIQRLRYMPGASAEVSFLQAPTEVEEGVQQRLSTYGASHVAVPSALLSSAADESSARHSRLRRSRQASLRQLGSATLEVDVAYEPRLPASDQLSGSALGRPSAYSTFDPVNGSVTRRVGRTQVSVSRRDIVVESGDDSVASPAAAPSSSTASSIIASEDDVNTDPQLLYLLDTLDKDESLDRFSVNSVSELVLRNQELVKQLYETTQRAEAAEQRNQHRQQEQQQQHILSERKGHRSTTHIADNHELPASLTATTTALLHHAETAANVQRYSAGMPSRKRERSGDSDGTQSSQDADSAPHVPHHHQQQQSSRRSDGLVHSEHGVGEHTHANSSAFCTAVSLGEADTRDDNDDDDGDSGVQAPGMASAAVEPWFVESASAAVTSMVDALVRRHEVRLTAVDTNVSRALLRALAAQREAGSATQQQQQQTSLAGAAAIDPFASSSSLCAAAGEKRSGDALAPAPSQAMAVCLRSLLQLCVRQSATLAEVALNAAGQQHEMQKAVKETWTAVQETLVRALQTSQVALTSHSSRGAETLVASSLDDDAPPQRRRTEAANASASTVVVSVTDHNTAPKTGALQRQDDFRVEEQVSLLQELSSLLHTAAKKDGTLLHVYQAAQVRQEARQHQQKEHLTRLLLKLERKRRLIKALRLRQTFVGSAAGNNNNDPAAVRGLSHAGQDGDISNANTQTSAAAPFRLSPQPGSPVHRTPPPPMSLPSVTIPGTPQLRGTQSNDDAGDHTDDRMLSQQEQQLSAEHSDNDSDDDVDGDVMTLEIFRELQQQLAVSQATHRTVQEELDEEKRKHTSMLERMWALETACDEAAAAKESLAKQMGDMVARDVYESLADELKKTTEKLQSRDAQLDNAAAELHTVQTAMAALKAQLESEQLQSKARVNQLEEAGRRREQKLAIEEDRYHELHAQLSDVKQHAATLENAIALARRELQEKTQAIREREDTIDELKSNTLMRDDVQAVLCRLFPGDSVLQANAQLVQHLSQSTRRLQRELAEVKQDLAHAQDELRRRELQVREVVQDRQAAEVRLQDAVARLAELQDVGLVRATNDESASVVGTHPHRVNTGPDSPSGISSPTLTNIDALFDVEEASVAGLRQRVRYLTTCMGAQAKDIAVMRDAEAAWKSREADLRRQLAMMSTDPISLTARKYGLTACANFADQMAEMQARQDALQHTVAAAETENATLKEKLAEAVKREAATEQLRADAAAQVRAVEEQLAAWQAGSQEQKVYIAVLEQQQQAAQAKHDDLLQQHQRTLTDLHNNVTRLAEVQASLDACRTQRDRFLKDNKQMISAVEKLEKALLQSEAEKKMAREALEQGLSFSAGRRHRGGGSHRGPAAERYSNQPSLTQELSLSSITPSP